MGVGTAEDEEEPPSDLFETFALALGKGGVGAAGSDLDCPPGLEREGDVEDDDAQEDDSERREEVRELVRAFFAFFALLLLLLLGDAAAGTPDGREPESTGDPRSGGGGMATAFWLPARPPCFLLFFLALGGGAPDADAGADTDADAVGTSAAAPDNESAAIPSAIAFASS